MVISVVCYTSINCLRKDLCSQPCILYLVVEIPHIYVVYFENIYTKYKINKRQVNNCVL